MQQKSIQFKFAIWTSIVLGVAMTISSAYGLLSTRRTAIESAKAQAITSARVEAAQVRAQLESPLNVVRTISQTLSATMENGKSTITREQTNNMMRQVMRDNPQFVALYADFEPNAFDGNDKAYANQPGYNSDGRFNFTWSRDENGDIKSDATPLGSEETDDWYQVPKRRLRESIIEPYYFAVQGKDVLETTLVTPIIVNNKFLGIVGVDIKITALQDMADRVNLYKRTGRLVLVSNAGIVAAATGNPGWINKKLQDVLPTMGNDLPAIRSGQQLVDFGAEHLKVLMPLEVGNTGTPWSALVLIPRTQITGPSTALMWKQILLGLSLLTIALMALWLFTSKFIAPIQAAARFATRVASGEAVNKLPVTTDDEIGQLLRAMNSMLENNSTLLQTRSERDRIQQSITKLLDDVSLVAEGDLTRQAEVTQDTTGAIADAFNYMIIELRRIIGKVQQVTQAVTHSVSESHQTTQHLVKDTQAQADQITRTSREMEAMAQSIRQVSQTAEDSHKVAQRSLTIAKNSSLVLRNTITRINGVRTQVQSTTQQIKDLSANSQQIAVVVQSISEIATRTSVLAMNAAIQAASAGDAGREFVVVAREVERFSKRATDTLKEINTLALRIQQGAHDAVETMDESSRSVTEGTQMIAEASEALGEIERVTLQLAELVQAIAQTTQQQARGSQSVARLMIDLSQATQETTSGLKYSAATVHQLMQLANELSVSVSSFKVAAHETGIVQARSARPAADAFPALLPSTPPNNNSTSAPLL